MWFRKVVDQDLVRKLVQRRFRYTAAWESILAVYLNFDNCAGAASAEPGLKWLSKAFEPTIV
jgi:hypothetical protein